MSWIERAIRFPVTTAVGVMLVALFGGIAVTRIPVQLTPTVEKPKISVITLWPGASPVEVEREIVDPQEEQLRGIEGLIEMESSSSDSTARITLRFQTGTSVESALLQVANRLQQVLQYPVAAEKPLIQTSGAETSGIAWFVVLPTEEQPFEGDISTLRDFIVDDVKPEIDRVRGVAGSQLYGGRKREMQVIVDPSALAARQVTLSELITAIDRENRNVSGGDFDEGKRRYLVRTVGEYSSASEIEAVVISTREGVPVRVGDVAHAELGFAKYTEQMFSEGEPTIAFSAKKRTGANVLEVMEELKETVDRLNRDLLAPRGLRIYQSYDETEYIVSAIDLVRQSLLLGGVFAICVLLLFLRSLSSTLIVAVAIPVSVVGTFLMMLWLGRSLNVISLAGMAFAVGMVVDNSIVVLENIYRHRQMGKSRARAALDGANEVWGAVLASTLTTIAVFLPILFIEEEAGQLFRDIAIAISCAVSLSLVVAMTVIPTLSAKIIGGVSRRREKESPISRLASWVAGLVYSLSGSRKRRVILVAGFAIVSIGLSFALMPKAEYLPVGKSNFLFGLLTPPPGYSVAEVAKLQEPFVESLAELWETPPDRADSLPGGGIDNFFFAALPDLSFVGAKGNDPTRVEELVGELQNVIFGIPGAQGFVAQWSLFQSDITEGRSIDIDLTGPELERLLKLGGQVKAAAEKALPGSQVWTVPALDLGNPELRIVPHRRRAAELGISSLDLGRSVSALVDGVKASEYRHEGRAIDLRVMAAPGQSHRTHLLDQLPIATPDGRLVPLSSVADMQMTNGATQVRRLERQRAVTVQVTPPDTLPLQAAMETIESNVLRPLIEAGSLDGLYRARLTGSADKLTQTGGALIWNFVLAVIISYLLMSALFEDFLYPLVILFTVPLAALGGFIGLAVVNLFTYQALDVLTMLGFIILVGTVVNNAILIVHQTINLLRAGDLNAREAVRDATRTRVRPIFMSVATSVFAMLPLVVFPGAGSELYRGLGSVVVGGLAVSAIFTLVLVPSLLSLVLEARAGFARRFSERLAATEEG